MALSMMACLTGCAGADRAIRDAAGDRAAIEETRALPALPSDCRRLHRSGVGAGDRIDVALLKTDAALVRHQAQTGHCAAWYDDLRAGWADTP